MPGLDAQPEVSILIPCYNAERYLRECLESALAQTHPRTEIIVVDDGSSDASVALARSFGPRVRCEPRPHRGGNVARNELLALARGPWLQYLDADDYLRPEKLARQMRLAAAPGAAWDVVNSPVLLRFESSGRERPIVIQPEADPGLHFIQWVPFGTIGPLFRREALQRVGGWKEDQPCCQEHELLLRLIMAGCRFGLLNEPLAVYRIHGMHTVSNRDPLRTARERMRLTDRMEAFLLETGGLSPAHRAALAVARLETARSVYRRDAALARQLFGRVMASGRRLWPRTPALPWRFQWVALCGGLDLAEKLAALLRRGRPAPGAE